MQPIIVTNCTNGKRGPGNAKLNVRSCPEGTVEQVGGWWLAERASYRGPTLPAGQRYKGRAFLDARTAAECVGGPLFVISAGMGLISSEYAIPDYDLTTTKGPDSIKGRILKGLWHPEQWWRVVNGSEDVLASLLKQTTAKVLIAASAPYLAMIQADLLAAPANALNRCRLFTSTLGAKALAGPLLRLAMPYDARLDGTGSSHRGTLSDFPQRALLHFVQAGWSIVASEPEEDARRVDEALRTYALRPRVKRSRLSDDELLAVLWEKRDTIRAAGKPPLRFVRDDLGIACEQGRFSRLYREFRTQTLAQESP